MEVLFLSAIYTIASILLLSAVFSVLQNNPVHAVLTLVVTVLSTSLLLFSSGAEVIAFMLLVVYVGAIAMLFLFVVMMIKVDDTKCSFRGFFSSRFLYVAIACLGLVQCFPDGYWNYIADNSTLYEALFSNSGSSHVTIKDIGMELYTREIMVFHMSGLLLLVAMVAAISISLSNKKKVKRQSIISQVYRKIDVNMIDVKPGEGVDF